MEQQPPTAGSRRRRRDPLERAIGIEGLLTAALLSVIVILRLRAPIGDPDLGWHLAAGAHILDSKALPATDHFSYVAAGQPWVVYSWLAEVFLALCDRVAGPLGLVTSAAVVIAGTFAIVLRTCRLAGARHTVAILSTAFAAAVSSPTWTVRPQMFSFLFLAIFHHLLVADRKRAHAHAQPAATAPLWFLVPLACLWANVHIFFVFGLLLLGLDGLCRPRDWLWNSSRRHLAPERFGLAIVVIAATLATPYGWRLWAYLVDISTQRTTFSMVTELQSPSLHEIHGQLLTAMFFATTLALTLSPARKHPADVAGVLIFAFLAYSMARNMVLFAIVAAPVLARHFETLLPRATRQSAPLTPSRRSIHVAALASLGLVFMIGLNGAPAMSRERAFSSDRYPVGAVDFLKAQPHLGRLFNHFNWGGYLIGHLYPRYRVSMDGRTAVYGDDTLRQYRATQFLEPGWQVFFDRCRPDVILWRKRDAFVRALELLPGWSRLYEDELAVIFVRADDRGLRTDRATSPKR